MVAAFKSGDPLGDIAARHGRTVRAIEARLEWLGGSSHPISERPPTRSSHRGRAAAMNRMHTFSFRTVGNLARNPKSIAALPDKCFTRFCLISNDFVVEDPVCQCCVTSALPPDLWLLAISVMSLRSKHARGISSSSRVSSSCSIGPIRTRRQKPTSG